MLAERHQPEVEPPRAQLEGGAEDVELHGQPQLAAVREDREEERAREQAGRIAAQLHLRVVVKGEGRKMDGRAAPSERPPGEAGTILL